MALRSDLKTFPGLPRQAFQHPSDVQAASALKHVPGLPQFVKFVSENLFEQVQRYQNISSHLRVGERQYPSLYRQFVRMAQVLDVKKLPTLFVSTTSEINAYAMGVENYAIVLCSGLLDILEEDEALAIMGHELGHVKCEHQLYNTMANWLRLGGEGVLSQAKIPGLDLLLSAGKIGIEFALMDWSRKAELSCDRAAALAMQDGDAMARALAKLAGFSSKYAHELNLDEVENQCSDYRELGDDSILVKLLKVQTMMRQTHPFPVVRVREVRMWSRSAEYADIVAGRYRALPGLGSKALNEDFVIETPRARRCPSCQRLSPDSATFCASCQANLRGGTLVCSKCRELVEAGWAACAGCGTWLNGSPSPPS
jgi:Zn-dependent protease with chaperone function